MMAVDRTYMVLTRVMLHSYISFVFSCTENGEFMREVYNHDMIFLRSIYANIFATHYLIDLLTVILW